MRWVESWLEMVVWNSKEQATVDFAWRLRDIFTQDTLGTASLGCNHHLTNILVFVRPLMGRFPLSSNTAERITPLSAPS
jgi:hypothetical protein